MKPPPPWLSTFSIQSLVILIALASFTSAVQMAQSDFENLLAIRARAPVLQTLWPDTSVLRNCGYIQTMNCSSTTGELSVINLQGCKLGVPIAMFMNFSSNLTRLAVEDAGLYGDFPQNMADKYPNVMQLAFSFNNITGTIPANIGNLSQLVALLLKKNHLENPLPLSLGNLNKLNTLLLSGNRFKCPFPDDLGARLENMSNLNFVDFAANNFSTDTNSLCIARPYKKLSFLPNLSYDLSPPAGAPDFSFNSTGVVVEIYGSRLFMFGRSRTTGVVERREYNLLQIQGLQFSSPPVAGVAPRVIAEFPTEKLTYATYNDTSKEYRVGVTTSRAKFEVGVIVDPSQLVDGASVKFSAYVSNLNYSGYDRSSITSISFPIHLFSKVPHTRAATGQYSICYDDPTGLGGRCTSPFVNISAEQSIVTGPNGPLFSVVFQSKSQLLDTVQVWPVTAISDGVEGFPVFERFYAAYIPYGLSGYYDYYATLGGYLPDVPDDSQGFGRMFSMSFNGAPTSIIYDPDFKLSLLADFNGDQSSPGTPSNAAQSPISTVDQAISSSGATAGIIAGVIVFLVVVGAVAVFIRYRQVQKEKESRKAVQSRIKSTMVGSEASFEPPKTEASTSPRGTWTEGSKNRASLKNQ